MRLFFAVALSLFPPLLHAQEYHLRVNGQDSTQLRASLETLARDLLARYHDNEPLRDLDNRFRLQLVAGDFNAAAKTIARLRELRVRRLETPAAHAADVQYEIWAAAKSASAKTGEPFATAFAFQFRREFARMDNRTAALVMRAMAVRAETMRPALNGALAADGSKSDISLAGALAMIKAYQRVVAHASVAQYLGRLYSEEDARRYVVSRNLTVRTADGATVCALMYRPRVAQRLPALVAFTIYVDSAANADDTRRTASEQYIGVTGYTRGKACSPNSPIPYRYDGPDAATLIEWIARQPYSNGRVGMYGGSYNGFSAWAAAKQMPPHLKAIMVGAAAAPGIDAPMEGNIVWNFMYPWPFYTTNNKTLDDTTYNDNNRWFTLSRNWYVSGRAYRDLPLIDGTPNPVWSEWIAHPEYDAYWQSMIPYREEFAKIKVPILQTAGYFYGGPGAAVYYLNEHYKYNPSAQHYLLIGPYDHPQGQRGVVSALGDTAAVISGYERDPVARIDIVADLRYQWFNWTLKGGPRPSRLEDRVNYEVMGINQWKHAASIRAMANDSLRLYLTGAASGDKHLLSRSPASSSVKLSVDLSYRADIDSTFPGGNVRDTAVNAYASVLFMSEPLASMEISGLYSGHLDFIINKKDIDWSVSLFELTPRGEYILLSPVQLRASNAHELATRRLLTPGVRMSLDFSAIRLMSRQIERGSRIVAILGPIKGPGQQINYGSGKNVSDETIADAGDPMTITLFGTSFLQLPVHH